MKNSPVSNDTANITELRDITRVKTLADTAGASTTAQGAITDPITQSISDGTIAKPLEVKTAANANSGQQGFIALERLYPFRQKIVPTASVAIKLFEDGLVLLDGALSELESDNVLNSDVHVQNLMGVIAELFCLRKVNDGLGLLAHSLFYAIQNQNGMPLNAEQLTQIRLVFYRGSKEPALDFDRALELVESYLEDAGFNTDPPEAAIYAKLLDA